MEIQLSFKGLYSLGIYALVYLFSFLNLLYFISLELQLSMNLIHNQVDLS